ncbi:MAG: hypothetical protein U0104_15150 [Gemmatimonadales bacterium]
MPTPPDPAARPDPLEHQRALLDDARVDLRRAAVALKAARAEAAAAGRDATARPHDPAAPASAGEPATVDHAQERLRAARASATRARASLAADLAQRIAPDPEQEVARLAGHQPIVLLPVRIETRFRGGDLLLRIYPDDILADGFEPELTDEEVADGTAFWAAAWPGETEERAAWKGLVGALGAARAAWVAQALTPTNLVARPAEPPVLPAVARREASWTRPAEARLLPDRWHVVLQLEDSQRIVTGAPIVEPLALTFSPDPDEPASPLGDDGLQLNDEVRWTVDFEAAVQVGMALRIPLLPAERQGFRRVIVYGVKSSLAPDVSATSLGELFTHHRHDRGLALVPQGTPTNNTSQAAAPYPPADTDGRRSFQVERLGLAAGPTRDGPRWAAALGLPAALPAHLDGADGREEERAGAMARALWPVTWGYFLRELMSPVFDDAAIESARQFFVNHVRGRGPLAAFRVGNTPYGVLPISSLAHWVPGSREGAAAAVLPDALRRLRDLWSAQVSQVARVGSTSDPDADLLATLGLDASTREVRVRPLMGEDALWNLLGLVGLGDVWAQWLDAGQGNAIAIFDRLGHPEWRARIARMNFNKDAWPFRYHLVTEEPVSETSPLAPNYLDWIRGAGVPELLQQEWPAGGERPVSLLYRLLRHGALLEYQRASYLIGQRYQVFEALDGAERELTGLAAAGQRPNRMAQMLAAVPQVTGTQPLHQFLAHPGNAGLVRALVPDESVVGYRDALGILSGAPTAELERLFTETLDLCSHRLDAWITALASRRLERLRAATPTGCHLGAYGWVEDLRPRPTAGAHPVILADGTAAARQSGNGGYVHAPSMTHAAAAAVLRNGYLSRTGADRQAYAVDLTSVRVRTARFVLDAVREGQPIGAVFGYQVERGLHDRGLDKYIAPLRARYPLVAAKTGDPGDQDPDDPGQPLDHIAARNVVDGLRLRTAWRDGEVPWGAAGFPVAGSDRAGVEAELVRLDDTVDAVSDLLLAEGVYQLVKGSPGVAAATLDAMAQGTVRPPDPEIATQPRRGTPLTHRVALVATGAAPLPAGYPGVATPRAALEPALDAWLGGLFGRPDAYQCEVEFGPIEAPTGFTQVTLADLGLRPIDLLLLADTAGQAAARATRAPSSELDRRVLEVAHGKLGLVVETEARIAYGRGGAFDPAVDRCFADFLELARAARAVLTGSRPLAPKDLVAEDREAEARAADHRAGEALGRVQGACDDLDLTRQAFEPLLAAARAAAPAAAFNLAPLRAALRGLATRGITGAWPASSFGNDPGLRPELVAQGESVLAEVTRRLDKARVILEEAAQPLHATDDRFRLGAARDALDLLVGAAMPFLPRFDVPAAAELGNALVQGEAPGFIAGAPAPRRAALRKFELVASRVRPPIGAWRRLELAGAALGAADLPRRVAQLPYDATARWAALPFADEASRPRAGLVSLLLLRADAPAVNAPWAGLLLDQWVETIPATTEQTGVAFHYDDPGAEAPQAVLVAVPPEEHAKAWRLDWLVNALQETLDLAGIRAVDGERLGALGQLLPAICLADSSDEVTVRTDFIKALAQERRIVARAEVVP